MDEEKEPLNPMEDDGRVTGAAEELPPGGASVADLEQQINELQQDLDDAAAKSKEYYEGWQRERADFINYKKRVERDQAQLTQSITGSVIKRFLVILDDLERALKARPEGEEVGKWAEGIELVYRKLQSILESEGVTRIPTENQMFDPNLHEAITHEESEGHQSGEIIDVVQQGYMIGDRVLRPALVRVAR